MADALVIVLGAYRDDANASVTITGTDPTSYTAHLQNSGTGSDGMITFAEASRTAAGATGTVSIDYSSAAGFGGNWRVVSLAPPGAVSGSKALLIEVGP